MTQHVAMEYDAMKPILLTLMVFAALTLHSARAFSYSVTPPVYSRQRTLENLSQRSELIVHGRVTRLETRYAPPPAYLPSGRDIIVTDLEVTITDNFKGDPRLRSVSITVPGGCISDICFVTDLFPKFDRDEEVLLFLVPNGSGAWALSDPILGKMKGDHSQINEIKNLPSRKQTR